VAIGVGEGRSVAWARPLASEVLWKRSARCRVRMQCRMYLGLWVLVKEGLLAG
jgi:hypothetical protein